MIVIESFWRCTEHHLTAVALWVYCRNLNPRVLYFRFQGCPQQRLSICSHTKKPMGIAPIIDLVVDRVDAVSGSSFDRFWWVSIMMTIDLLLGFQISPSSLSMYRLPAGCGTLTRSPNGFAPRELQLLNAARMDGYSSSYMMLSCLEENLDRARTWSMTGLSAGSAKVSLN